MGNTVALVVRNFLNIASAITASGTTSGTPRKKEVKTVFRQTIRLSKPGLIPGTPRYFCSGLLGVLLVSTLLATASPQARAQIGLHEAIIGACLQAPSISIGPNFEASGGPGIEVVGGNLGVGFLNFAGAFTGTSGTAHTCFNAGIGFGNIALAFAGIDAHSDVLFSFATGSLNSAIALSTRGSYSLVAFNLADGSLNRFWAFSKGDPASAIVLGNVVNGFHQ